MYIRCKNVIGIARGTVTNMPDEDAKFFIARGEAEPFSDTDPDVILQALQNETQTLWMRKLAENAVRNHANPREPSLGDFIQRLREKGPPERMSEFYPGGAVRKAAMNGGAGSQGGYILPTRLARRILSAGEPGRIRQAATLIPSSSVELDIPVVDSTSLQPAGTSPFFGGLQLSWFREGALPPESEQALKQLAMALNFLGGVIKMSNPWLNDTDPAILEGLLAALFGRAIHWYEEYAFLRGSGVGQPQGIVGAPGTLQVNRQNPNQVAYLDVATMQSKLLPESYTRALWMFSPSTVPQLLQLKDGAGRAAFLQVGASPEGQTQWTILGQPAYPTEKLPALGTTGDLILIDPALYVITDHQTEAEQAAGAERSLAIAISGEASTDIFYRNQSIFLIAQRVDGRPWLDKPVTLQDGVTQVSPFVVLN